LLLVEGLILPHILAPTTHACFINELCPLSTPHWTVSYSTTTNGVKQEQAKQAASSNQEANKNEQDAETQ
jgi:hypothetical protein